FIAGGISKSSAMISEGVHSLVDSVNELLLLYGIHRSNRQRDKTHPFGYGRELYFWSFIVAILIFALGAGVSFYQGVSHIRHPQLAGDFVWNYAVLGISFISEGSSFLVALKEFNKTRGAEGLWAAIKRSKDPATFMVLFEDGAALLGVVVVFVCLFIGQQIKNLYLDGVASLLIGLILTIASALLARESRSLLMGEGISPQTEQNIIELIEKDFLPIQVKKMFSIYESPEEVLLVLILDFPSLDTEELNNKIDAVKEAIRKRYPKINYIIIQPD
ncbi:MAG: cation diffusion facilitator family transporter, partial [Bacteroidota bacterium]